MNSEPTRTVELNVGGRHFEASRSLLEEHPGSALCRFVADAAEADDDSPAFIDRDGDVFAQVLNYLRYGSVALPVNIVKSTFLRDLDYYGIPHDDDGKIVSFSPNASSGAEADRELLEENRALRERVRSLSEIEITGPDHHPVYARGHLKENGHLSSLGAKGKFWTEWLERGENSCRLENIPGVEVWIGGTLRGGFSDNFQVLCWTRLGQKPLLLLCSRPGNLVLSVNFGWTEEELDAIVDLDQFCETRDDELLRFVCEDLAMEDRGRTCSFVSVSLPTVRNRLLGPSDDEGEGPPRSIWIG